MVGFCKDGNESSCYMKYGRIYVLNYILEQNKRARTGLMLFRLGLMLGFCENGNESSCYMKYRRIYVLAK